MSNVYTAAILRHKRIFYLLGIVSQLGFHFYDYMRRHRYIILQAPAGTEPVNDSITNNIMIERCETRK